MADGFRGDMAIDGLSITKGDCDEDPCKYTLLPMQQAAWKLFCKVIAMVS